MWFELQVFDFGALSFVCVCGDELHCGQLSHLGEAQ
jgi:hypothetical protein